MLSILVPKNTPRMAPKWEPKWSQNGPLALPKSTVGDCKVIPGRPGHPDGAVRSPRAPFGYPREPFWLRFRARKRTQPCTDTLLKPTTSPTLSSVFHLVFFLSFASSGCFSNKAYQRRKAKTRMRVRRSRAANSI